MTAAKPLDRLDHEILRALENRPDGLSRAALWYELDSVAMVACSTYPELDTRLRRLGRRRMIRCTPPPWRWELADRGADVLRADASLGFDFLAKAEHLAGVTMTKLAAIRLLAAIRAHPHLGAVLGQFEVDAHDGLDEEEYDGESVDRSQVWAMLYELLSGKPLPCARCEKPAVPDPDGLRGTKFCLRHWQGGRR